MIVDDIKKRTTVAMKAGDAVARDVLRLALGEIQMGAERKGTPATDEDAKAALRKLVKSNEETIAALPDGDERIAALKREIEVLNEVTPAQLSVHQIVEALAEKVEALKAAGNDGQATGIAMKHLKAAGADVNGQDVGVAVKRLRTP